MKVIKDFILDYWRELVVLLFVGLLLFFFLGYRSRGNEINQLKDEVALLRNNDNNVISSDSPTDSVQENTEQQAVDEPTVDNSTEDESPFNGFSITSENGWTLSETVESNSAEQGDTYIFNKGTQDIELTVNPGNTSFATDVTWIIEFKKDDNNYVSSVLSNSRNLCVQGQSNCTAGDGRLQISVNDAGSDNKLNTVFIYYTNSDTTNLDSSFVELTSFIENLQTSLK